MFGLYRCRCFNVSIIQLQFPLHTQLWNLYMGIDKMIITLKLESVSVLLYQPARRGEKLQTEIYASFVENPASSLHSLVLLLLLTIRYYFHTSFCKILCRKVKIVACAICCSWNFKQQESKIVLWLCDGPCDAHNGVERVCVWGKSDMRANERANGRSIQTYR